MPLTLDGDDGISGIDGSAATPAIQGADSNTGITFGTDIVNVVTGGSTRATVDASGRLLVGTSTARSNDLFGSSHFQLEATGAADSSIQLTRNAANTGAGGIAFCKSRSASNGGVTVVQSGDVLGFLDFEGADGTDFAQAANIRVEVDGTPGNNDMPGRIVFSTTADGASSPTERMKINNLGEFFAYDVYNSTSASAANVVVVSSGRMIRSTSSGKYKTDIETLEDSYADALLNCRPVWYRSTCEGDNPEHGWWGFIAEEVAEIDPRLVHWKTIEVTYDEKGSAVETPCDPEPEGVAYDRFVPHLLNLIKRQKEAIEALETRVAQLEGGAS